MNQPVTTPPRSLADMPSPPGLPILGDAMDFIGNQAPWDVMLDYARRIGPIARVDLPGSDVVLVSDPDAVTRIMVTGACDFYKKSPAAALRPAHSPILAITPSPTTFRHLRLLRGVEPVLMPFASDPADTIESAISLLRRLGLVTAGDKLILASDIVSHDQKIDSVQLRTVK